MGNNNPNFNYNNYNDSTNNNFLLNFNLKHLFISFDELIIDSLNYGNMHFFITINFNENIKNKNKIEKEIIKLNNILNNIDLWSWNIIVSEKNKNENYHIHLVLAIRSCIGYNDIIENNILFYLRNNYEIDTKINFCLKFIDIKKTLKYLFKDFEKKNNLEIVNKLKNDKIVFISVLKQQINLFNFIKKFFEIKIYIFKEKLNKNLHLIEEKLIEEKEEEENINENIIYKNNNEFFNNFIGVKIDKKEYSEKQTIFVWNLFLTLDGLFLYKNNIYKKLKKYNISYEFITSDEYLFNNFIIIIEYLKKKLYFHFNNFDNSNYFSNFLKNKEEKLERLKNYTSNKLNPSFYLMEFTDGVYKISENKFIKKENLDILKNEQTIKYYNYTYKHLSLPTIWLNGVKKVLNIKIENNIINKIISNLINLEKNENKIKNLIDLLIYIAYVFHFSSNILNKKSTMYLWGPSNTGKTTLIIDLFINYFGKENVGLLSNNKNFSYQDIIDKLVIILDEFDLTSIKTEDFKKIINKELILGEKKNKEPQIIKPTPLIISSNKNIMNEQYLENKESITNRLKIIHFNNPIEEENMDFNIKEKIKNEEAKIIILCNKVYFNFLKNKEEKIENIKYFIEEKIK